jgi:hypothetical protein
MYQSLINSRPSRPCTLWLVPLCKTCLDPNGRFVSSVALSAISMPACSTLMTDDQCLRTRANTPCACRFCIVAIDARADSDLLILSFNGVLFNSPNRYGMMICIWATCWVTCSAKQFNRYCNFKSRMLVSWVGTYKWIITCMGPCAMLNALGGCCSQS